MGKKQPKTVRTTISMPRELKQRMDKVPDEVNWSALACQAFREKLAESDFQKKEIIVKSNVVERMLARKTLIRLLAVLEDEEFPDASD